MSEKIRLENVVKIYGNAPRKQPLKMLQAGVSKDEIFEKTGHVVGLNDVTFSVKEGETFVVMGLSGSGKSTLIRCVNRLIESTSGSIYIDDQDVTTLNKKELRQLRREKLAMVFQHFGLFPHKTVVYNAGYGLQVRGMSEKEWRKRAEEALAMVGLREWADHYPHNLSGGMQQRVGLARALATDADILLMDEAFSALDPLIRREMQDELMALQEKLQKTILFITHDLGEALRVGNRVAVMRDGAVVQIGTPQEIITTPADDYVAEFMADVDSGRVLTAEFIMSPHVAMDRQKHSVQDALKRMDEHNRRWLYVIDKSKRVDGIVSRKRLIELRNEGVTDITKAIRGEYPRTSPLARLNELYDMCATGVPIAVLGDGGKLWGVVQPLDVFNALSTTGDYASGNDYRNGNGTQDDSAEAVIMDNPVVSAGD